MKTLIIDTQYLLLDLLGSSQYDNRIRNIRKRFSEAEKGISLDKVSIGCKCVACKNKSIRSFDELPIMAFVCDECEKVENYVEPEKIIFK